jgi:hypothetical protein
MAVSPNRRSNARETLAPKVADSGWDPRGLVLSDSTDEIEFDRDDIGGIAVDVSARIQAKAEPSEVLVSRTVKDLVAGSRFPALG